MENLADVAVFVRVVDSGSFTRAAAELELSKAVVSKYVSRLEQRLGARLLHRTTRRLTLTEAGEALYQRSAGALAELGDAEREVAQLTGAPRGRLRVSAPMFYGVIRLAPLLKEFHARYPEITLDIDFDDRLVDLVKERYDVALRIATVVDPGLHTRRLAVSRLVVVGSPEYLARHGVPKAPADLVRYPCLIYTLGRSAREWTFRTARGRPVSVTVSGALQCNNDFVLRQAALDGLGLGMPPRFLVEDELAAGRLVEVLRDYQAPELYINAVYTSRRNLLPKVRAFIDFLAGRVAEPA